MKFLAALLVLLQTGYVQAVVIDKLATDDPGSKVKRVALILSGYDGEAVRQAAKELGRTAPAAHDVKVWGPTPAFYALLRGQTRERLLVQAGKSVDVQAYLKAWLARVKVPASVRVAVDVDPVSFF